MLLAAILWPRGEAGVHGRQSGDLEREALGDSTEPGTKLCSNLPRSLCVSPLQKPLFISFVLLGNKLCLSDLESHASALWKQFRPSC